MSSKSTEAAVRVLYEVNLTDVESLEEFSITIDLEQAQALVRQLTEAGVE